jgi:VIT1/CCC1 family predicted Fe2+/Mn2+ transporter
MVAFIFTIGLLVLPYILLGDPFLSLLIVLILAAMLILIMNYNLAVVKAIDFKRRATEMLGMSLGIAGITFVLGYIIREVLHIGH